MKAWRHKDRLPFRGKAGCLQPSRQVETGVLFPWKTSKRAWVSPLSNGPCVVVNLPTLPRPFDSVGCKIDPSLPPLCIL